MFRKISSINLLMAVIFLLTTIFPSSLFSYETVDRQDPKLEKVDESLGYEGVTFKKVRCPQCGMEFYYVPGKESPHSHWVQYEIPDEGSERKVRSGAARQEEKGILGLFTQNKNSEREIGEASSEREFPFSQIDREQFKEYELRQKLSCPYDGYDFFPEGDVIEERKLMKDFLSMEPLSSIESSFAKSIPFGVSKDLRQFGYDLFVLQEKSEKEKEESTIAGRSTDALSTLGMLKAAFTPNSSTSSFSSLSSNNIVAIPIGHDYVIGPGDTLIINIWGSVQESFPVEVDREGKIILPKAGPLYLWGVKFQEAETRIRERLNQFYTNFNVDVSMGKLREIQIYVLGEVKKPGIYGIDSRSTVSQALLVAGGITKLGSLRKIKLMHADGQEKIIDLYPFILEGELARPIMIQSGDTIFVPIIGDVVAIAGNVKRPAIYETKSEILLADLLTFAGGVTPTGDLERLQVERVRNNERRVMLDMGLKRTDVGRFSLEGINMENGDLVIVSPIVRLKHDFVSVLGNVERPADYALSEDMRVSDLINRAKGFMPGTYLYRAEIARITKDRTREIIPVDLDKLMLGEQEEDVLLNEWDILLVYSEAEVQSPSFVEIDGAVNWPGKYELAPGMKVSDLIFKAGGAKLDETIRGAELFHIMPGEQSVIREISIKQLPGSINVSLDKDIILRAGDSLFIKSEPKLTERKLAEIEGEVRFPGNYSIREGERLSSLLERVGGFTKEAFLDGTVFTRESIRESQEKMRQKFLERESRTLLEEQQSILLRGSTSGIVARSAESLKARESMLDFIKDIEIQGRMVIKMLSASELKGTKYDILLDDGDSIFIPQIPASVSIIGSVNNSISVPFESSKGINYYIRRAGGLTRHADKSGIYVLRANGEAISKFTMSKSIMRGDTIVVPQELKVWTPPGTILKDTVEILSRMAIGIGIIAALD